jgi:hypothetical protein
MVETCPFVGRMEGHHMAELGAATWNPLVVMENLAWDPPRSNPKPSGMGKSFAKDGPLALLC